MYSFIYKPERGNVMDAHLIVKKLKEDFPVNNIEAVDIKPIDDEFTRMTLNIDGRTRDISLRTDLLDDISSGLQKCNIDISKLGISKENIEDVVYDSVKLQVECVLDSFNM